MINVNWQEFKEFIGQRGLTAQFISTRDIYYVAAFDGFFHVHCTINKSLQAEDVADFEANYKAAAEKATAPVVTTQFEKNDKDLKLASARQAVGEDGTATILFLVPGTPGSGDGRFVAGGIAWFDITGTDDRVKVYITDEDNLTGQGEGFVLKSYTDEEMPEEQQGWRIPPKKGQIEVEPIGGYGFLPAGFYLKLTGIRDPINVTEGNFLVNIFWGKLE